MLLVVVAVKGGCGVGGICVGTSSPSSLRTVRDYEYVIGKSPQTARAD